MLKNRQRWTFGGLYPKAYSVAQEQNDPHLMQTECLVQGDSDTRVDVQVRFLHLTARMIGQLDEAVAELAAVRDVPHRLVDVRLMWTGGAGNLGKKRRNEAST